MGDLNYDFFVVVDFEETCDNSETYEKYKREYPHEIIEFPVVLVSAREKKIVDVFHSFVRPTQIRSLSEYCRNLTKISQHTVDKAEAFGVVHREFLGWMAHHGLGTRCTFTVVTDGLILTRNEGYYALVLMNY